MDAVGFLKTKNRMCAAYLRALSTKCDGCPLDEVASVMCSKWCFNHAEEAVGIVERWAEQNPVKTRQSEFLKQWPNAERYCSGALSVCPKSVDRNLKLDCSRPCDKCCSQFWLEEIE
jgi:hypothetical protein